MTASSAQRPPATPRRLAPGLALLAAFALALAAASPVALGAQVVAPGTPAPHPGPGPQPIPGPVPVPKPGGPGGQYHGPTDVVPPNLPQFDPNVSCSPATQAPCNPALLPTTRCGTACPGLPLVPHVGDDCVHCQGDPDGMDGQCFLAKGWDLTFGTARAFCHSAGTGCLDSNRNVTACVTQPDACEVHLLESDWINHDLFAGRPVCAPVATQACIDGARLFAHPHSLDSETHGGLSCGQHTVCLTFNRDCFCNAVLAWEAALGGGASSYDGKFLFHVGFTTCETCNCPGQEP